MSALDRIAVADPKSTVGSALDAARELLDMDIAYFSEFSDGRQVIRGVEGDPSPFGFDEGTEIALEETFCRRMVEGTIPNALPEGSQDPRVSDLPAGQDGALGAYVGVPLRLPDGRVYGTFCCAHGKAKPDLDDRDVAFMRVLARVLGDHLGREETAVEPTAEDGREGLLATLHLWFAGAPNAAAAARSALGALDEHLDDATGHQLRLVVTELIANSVRHSGVGPAGAVGLDVRVAADRLRAEVSDPGPGFEPEVKPATPDDLDRTGGWGFLLVDELTERGGVDRNGLTRVWFELPFESEQPTA